MNSIDDNDEGYDELVRELDNIDEDEPGLTVGVHAEDNTRESEVDGASSVNLAYLMAIHVYGLGVPQRDPIRPVLDENEDRYGRIQRAAYGQVLDGDITMERALHLLGQAVKGDIVDRFGDKSHLKANAPATIEQKTTSAGVGDAPLIDDAQLKQSVDYQLDDED